MRKIVIILVIFSLTLFADNIYFKNGGEIHNCEVLEQNQNQVRVRCYSSQGRNYVQVFGMNSINNIQEKEINTTVQTKFLQSVNNNKKSSKDNSFQNRRNGKYRFNWSRQPFTILAGFIAWQNFHGFDEWMSTGGALKDLKLSEDEWGDPKDKEKIKRNVVFSVSAGLAIVNFFSSFEPVEVRSTGNGVEFSYSF